MFAAPGQTRRFVGHESSGRATRLHPICLHVVCTHFARPHCAQTQTRARCSGAARDFLPFFRPNNWRRRRRYNPIKWLRPPTGSGNPALALSAAPCNFSCGATLTLINVPCEQCDRFFCFGGGGARSLTLRAKPPPPRRREVRLSGNFVGAVVVRRRRRRQLGISSETIYATNAHSSPPLRLLYGAPVARHLPAARAQLQR